jgi:hypothetical protein
MTQSVSVENQALQHQLQQHQQKKEQSVRPKINLPEFCQTHHILVPRDFWSFWYAWKTGTSKEREALVYLKTPEGVRVYAEILQTILDQAYPDEHKKTM